MVLFSSNCLAHIAIPPPPRVPEGGGSAEPGVGAYPGHRGHSVPVSAPYVVQETHCSPLEQNAPEGR